MRRLVASISLTSLLLTPASSLALEGTGPRATVTGTVTEVRITEKQKFDEYGGELSVLASNGQVVTIILDKTTKIISEGKLSRKELLPVNVSANMQIRARGWRVGSDTITASLIIIMNLELNPSYAVSGVIQSTSDSGLTILTQDGQNRTFAVDSGTEVNVDYKIRGASGLSLIGKQVSITLNSYDQNLIRIIRITGEPEPLRSKPSTVDLRQR